jgi:hypothetical protein
MTQIGTGLAKLIRREYTSWRAWDRFPAWPRGFPFLHSVHASYEASLASYPMDAAGFPKTQIAQGVNLRTLCSYRGDGGAVPPLRYAS